MKVEIKVPAMGESISEAVIGEIFKSSGSQVKVDEELLELETDKVNQVLYAPEGGVVEFIVQTEDAVQIGQVIGYVDTEAAVVESERKKSPREKIRRKRNSKLLKNQPGCSKTATKESGSRERNLFMNSNPVKILRQTRPFKGKLE